jgi:hypothetical protein
MTFEFGYIGPFVEQQRARRLLRCGVFGGISAFCLIVSAANLGVSLWRQYGPPAPIHANLHIKPAAQRQAPEWGFGTWSACTAPATTSGTWIGPEHWQDGALREVK